METFNDTINESILYARTDQETIFNNVETLIKEINIVGLNQARLIDLIKNSDLEKETNYKNFVDAINNNYFNLKDNLNLCDLYLKGHKNSLCPYEFIIISSLSLNNAKELILESLKNRFKQDFSTKVILRVKMNTKSQSGLKLPLISHNGFYQILNKNDTEIISEFISLKSVKKYLIENKLNLMNISIVEQHNTSSLRDCFFQWGDLK